MTGSAKNVTRLDVARRAGVSPSTVTRALNDHPKIPEDTRRRIKALAKQLGYTPSTLVRRYYQNRSFQLGVVIPFEAGRERHPLPYEYFSKTLFGVNEAAQRENYSVGIITDDRLPAEQLARFVLTRSVDGLIFLANVIGDTRFAYLHKQGVPFIFIHHHVRRKPYLYIDCDSRTGMAEAFQHAASRGVKRVGFLGGGDQYVNSVERKAIVLELARRYGFRVVRVLDGDYSRRSGFLAAPIFLSGDRPDLVFCANDRMAFGLLEGFRDQRVGVPEQIGVIGFDDLEIGQMAVPPLTTIQNPFFDIGRAAGATLIAAIRGLPAGSKRLPTRLIVRQSA
ncbi:MAG: LacI family DNA-binding transcriptional regulator [Kiritimatiellae bacterium]|nr:LacI family DNA-binding transcriptional regulator [Kiritimatiellia bacterium]